jgi:hypothetical protein
VAAFLATGVSVDPAVRAPSPPTPRAHRASFTPDEQPRYAHGIGEARGAAPPDLALEIGPDGHQAHRVVVRRPGFLVALRNEDARAAGVDSAAIRVAARGGAGSASAQLIWETTTLDAAMTARGLVALTDDGATLSGELQSVREPEPAASFATHHAKCAAHHDGLGGFSVLCRFPSTVRVTGIANTTGAHALDDAWLVLRASPLVRFDLARAPSGAEGRLVAMVQGGTAVVLTVEARFPAHEEPSLVFHESRRTQPAPLP